MFIFVNVELFKVCLLALLEFVNQMIFHSQYWKKKAINLIGNLSITQKKKQKKKWLKFPD